MAREIRSFEACRKAEVNSSLILREKFTEYGLLARVCAEIHCNVVVNYMGGQTSAWCAAFDLPQIACRLGSNGTWDKQTREKDTAIAVLQDASPRALSHCIMQVLHNRPAAKEIPFMEIVQRDCWGSDRQ